jgi:GntR family transcriptional repressor for pyruvate dehydrogenase complex
MRDLTAQGGDVQFMDRDPRRVDSEGTDSVAAMESRFAVIPRSTLPEEIAHRLLTLIKDQHLRPGDRLPAERSLAEMMDVSRPVVREALRALAFMGVVDIRQGAGTYVASLEPRQLIAHLSFAFAKDTVALVQLLEARRVIEAGNARLAALRIKECELSRLEDLVVSLANHMDDPNRFSDADVALHEAISAAADNFLLSQFTGVISTLGKASRERTSRSRGVREATVRDHWRILGALRAHDANAAERAMLDHLDHVEAGLALVAGSNDMDPPASGVRGAVVAGGCP